MRIAKLSKTDELVEKHGRYAEVMGLVDSPSGVQARLRFGDGHRAVVSTRRIRILQDENVPRSKDSWF